LGPMLRLADRWDDGGMWRDAGGVGGGVTSARCGNHGRNLDGVFANG